MPGTAPFTGTCAVHENTVELKLFRLLIVLVAMRWILTGRSFPLWLLSSPHHSQRNIR